MEKQILVAKAGDTVLKPEVHTGKIVNARLAVSNDKSVEPRILYTIQGLPELYNEGQLATVSRSLSQALKVDDTGMVLSNTMQLNEIKIALKRYVVGQEAVLEVSAHEQGAWVPVTEFTRSPAAEGKEVGDTFEATKAGYHVPSEITINFSDEILDKLEEKMAKERALATKYEF